MKIIHNKIMKNEIEKDNQAYFLNEKQTETKKSVITEMNYNKLDQNSKMNLNKNGFSDLYELKLLNHLTPNLGAGQSIFPENNMHNNYRQDYNCGEKNQVNNFDSQINQNPELFNLHSLAYNNGWDTNHKDIVYRQDNLEKYYDSIVENNHRKNSAKKNNIFMQEDPFLEVDNSFENKFESGQLKLVSDDPIFGENERR